MTDGPTTQERLLALQAARHAADTPPASPPAATRATSAAPTTRKSSGPAPGRIVAAAASVSAGIGLVALMAGAQQDVVVQVNPTPITVQPGSIIVEMAPAVDAATASQAPQVEVRTVEPAVPAERPAPQARVVTQSEGS